MVRIKDILKLQTSAELWDKYPEEIDGQAIVEASTTERSLLSKVLETEQFFIEVEDSIADTVNQLVQKDLMREFNPSGESNDSYAGKRRVTVTPAGCWTVCCPYIFAEVTYLKNLLPELAELIAFYWQRACQEDGIDPSSKFVVFTESNESANTYNDLMRTKFVLRRVLR